MQKIKIDSSEKLVKFMQWFDSCDLDDKMQILLSINNSIAIQRLADKDTFMLSALQKWCGVNATVGTMLCQPCIEMFDHFYSNTIVQSN